MRCCEQLLYIWLISHIETKRPIFNNFWWFSKKIIGDSWRKESKDLNKENWKVKLHGIPQGEVKWKAPWMRATYYLMSCGQRWWVPLMRVTRYVSYTLALVMRQLRGVQHVPRTIGLSQFSRLFKDQFSLEVMKNIKQDRKLLVLVKKESDGLRDPVTSEKYPRWRNL